MAVFCILSQIRAVWQTSITQNRARFFCQNASRSPLPDLFKNFKENTCNFRRNLLE
jgi:hypothetical protein